MCVSTKVTTSRILADLAYGSIVLSRGNPYLSTLALQLGLQRPCQMNLGVIRGGIRRPARMVRSRRLGAGTSAVTTSVSKPAFRARPAKRA